MDSFPNEPKHEFLFLQKDLPLKSFQAFAGMRLNGDLCDVTFVVGNLQVSAHRLVLAAAIPYFHAVFVKKIDEGRVNETILQNIEPKAFESLICYVYNCEIKIDEENVKSLLIGASTLFMDDISDACSEFILNRMDYNNALSVREFAVTHNISRLKKLADEFVQKHFTEISRSSAFLELPFSDVKEILEKDETHLTEEQEIYQAALTWVKASPEDREDKFPELLRSVRMPSLSYDFLSTCVASEDLVQKSPSCMKLLQEAKDLCKLTDRTNSCRRQLYEKSVNFPCCQDVSCDGHYIYAVCRILRVPNPTVIVRYCIASGKWKMMKARTMYIAHPAVVTIDRNFYVIGGCNSIGRALDSVLQYCPESDCWIKKGLLGRKKKLVSAASSSNAIFACGGQVTEGDITDEVECYCSEKDEWTYLPSMLHCRSGACSASLNENIYVLGGLGYDSFSVSPCFLSSAERYDPEVKQWVEISDMSTTQYLCGATSLNGKIYVHGKEFLEVYDPWLREWDRVCEVKTNKTVSTLLAFDGKLYTVGSSCSRTVDTYDPETGEWNAGEPFPEQLRFIGAGKISLH